MGEKSNKEKQKEKKKRKKAKGKEEHLKGRETLKKIPLLKRIEHNRVIRERTRKILKDADKVYVPAKAKEEAMKKEKESMGKTRLYEIEKEGEKIAVAVPRFKDKYSLYNKNDKVIENRIKMRDRTLQNKEQFEKAMKEGEIGIAHTHPKKGEAKASEKDKRNLRWGDVPSDLVVSKVDSSIIYESRGGEIKEKKAHYVPKEEIEELLEEEVKERAKETGKPLMKKKHEESKEDKKRFSKSKLKKKIEQAREKEKKKGSRKLSEERRTTMPAEEAPKNYKEAFKLAELRNNYPKKKDKYLEKHNGNIEKALAEATLEDYSTEKKKEQYLEKYEGDPVKALEEAKLEKNFEDPSYKAKYLKKHSNNPKKARLEANLDLWFSFKVKDKYLERYDGDIEKARTATKLEENFPNLKEKYIKQYRKEPEKAMAAAELEKKYGVKEEEIKKYKDPEELLKAKKMKQTYPESYKKMKRWLEKNR